MTDKHPVIVPGTEDTVRARLARPMPHQVRRELDACICIDQLGETLTRTRAALEAAVAAAEAMSSKAPASVVQAGWKASLAEVVVMFDQADAHGRATIKAVRVILALE